jgi:hypothetical protein
MIFNNKSIITGVFATLFCSVGFSQKAESTEVKLQASIQEMMQKPENTVESPNVSTEIIKGAEVQPASQPMLKEKSKTKKKFEVEVATKND